MTTRTMRLLAVGALLVLAACSSGDDDDRASTTVANTTTSTRAATSTTAAAAARFDFEWFSSPSTKIGCRISDDAVRCDVSEHSWSNLPPKPADCEFDWGGTLIVDDSKPGHIGCISDSELGSTDIVPYGEAVRRNGFTCRSEQTGMECRNDATQHGFVIARTKFEVF